MKRILSIVLMFTAILLFAQTAADQEELPDPGITPDSPFYFADRMFDRFKSPEAQADERVAEMVVMAQKGDEEGLKKATEGYKEAIKRQQKESEKDEETAEKVARQSSKHLAVLARVREKVSAKTKAGVDRALNESAKVRENAISALRKKNPERAGTVARETLQRVMEKAPEQALPGLQRALEAGRKGEPKEESEKSHKADKSKAEGIKEKTEKSQKTSVDSEGKKAEKESWKKSGKGIEKTEKSQKPSDQQEGKKSEEESAEESRKQSKGTKSADSPQGKAGKKQ